MLSSDNLHGPIVTRIDAVPDFWWKDDTAGGRIVSRIVTTNEKASSPMQIMAVTWCQSHHVRTMRLRVIYGSNRISTSWDGSRVGLRFSIGIIAARPGSGVAVRNQKLFQVSRRVDWLYCQGIRNYNKGEI